MKKYSHGGNIYNKAPLRNDFSVNLNPLGMPEEVKRAIESSADKMSAYPDPDCMELCRRIAGVHGVLPENVLCGNGAADIIIRIALALKPKAVLSLAPGFSEYEKAARLCGAAFKTHTLSPENDFHLDNSVLDAVTADVGLVYICNPNNPTGRLCEGELMAALLKKCEAVGAVLAVDECFIGFTNAPSMQAYLNSPSLVIINALTKSYAMAGLRLGYMLSSNAALIKKVSDFSQSWSVSSVAQIAGIAALDCGEHLKKARALIEKERSYLSSGLSGFGVRVFPSDANFLLCFYEAPISSRLLKWGIMVRDCSNFAGLDARYFRVCISARRENDLLLREISEVLNG